MVHTETLPKFMEKKIAQMDDSKKKLVNGFLDMFGLGGDVYKRQVLQIVSLTNTGKKKAGQFSLGMKQRLGIAKMCIRDSRRRVLCGFQKV